MLVLAWATLRLLIYRGKHAGLTMLLVVMILIPIMGFVYACTISTGTVFGRQVIERQISFLDEIIEQEQGTRHWRTYEIQERDRLIQMLQ